MYFDLHFTKHGVVWANQKAKNFINTYSPNLTSAALYRLAIERGFQVSFETTEIRDRLTKAN